MENNKRSEAIEVSVTRTRVQRAQLAQLLAPIAVGSGIVARRFPELVSPYFVIAFLGLCFAICLSSIKRLGTRRLLARAGAIDLGPDLSVKREQLLYWAHDSELARIYGHEESFALRTQREHGALLSAQLTQAFGPGHQLQPRGSRLARRIMLGSSAGCLLVAASTLIFHQLALLFLGIAFAIASLVTYASLCQRVLRL